MSTEHPARRSRTRRRWTLVVAGAVLVLAAIPFVWTTFLGPADAKETVQAVADGLSEGDNETLRSLVCTTRPEEGGPVPDKFVDGQEPVTVRAVDVEGESATATMRLTNDSAMEYGMLLIRSDEQGWCVYGLGLCPVDGGDAGSYGATICTLRPR